MFTKFDLAALKNSLIMWQIFLQCGSTNSHVYFAIVGRKLKAMTLKKKVLPIQFSLPCQKNKKVLNALDTKWRCLQREGADMATFFRLEKKLQEMLS